MTSILTPTPRHIVETHTTFEARVIINSSKEFLASIDHMHSMPGRPMMFTIARVYVRNGRKVAANPAYRYPVLKCFHVTSHVKIAANNSMVAHIDLDGRHVEVMLRNWTREADPAIYHLADNLLMGCRRYVGPFRIEENRATAASAVLVSKEPTYMRGKPRSGVVPDDTRERERRRYADKHSPAASSSQKLQREQGASSSRKSERKESKSVGMPRGFGRRMQQTIKAEPTSQRTGPFSSILVGKPPGLKELTSKSPSGRMRGMLPKKGNETKSKVFRTKRTSSGSKPPLSSGINPAPRLSNLKKRLFSKTSSQEEKDESPKKRRVSETRHASESDEDGMDISPSTPLPKPRLSSRSTGNTSSPTNVERKPVKKIPERVKPRESVPKGPTTPSRSPISGATQAPSKVVKNEPRPKISARAVNWSGSSRTQGSVVIPSQTERGFASQVLAHVVPPSASRSSPSSNLAKVPAPTPHVPNRGEQHVRNLAQSVGISYSVEPNSSENSDCVEITCADLPPNAPSPVGIASLGADATTTRDIDPGRSAAPPLTSTQLGIPGTSGYNPPLDVGEELDYISAVDPSATLDGPVEDIDVEMTALVTPSEDKSSESLGGLSPTSYYNQPSQGGGIANIGNTCYIAATLQLFLNDDIFMNQLRRKVNSLSEADRARCGMSVALLQLHESKERGDTLNADAVKAAIEKYAPDFSGFRQQDAQEFITNLTSLILEELNAPLSDCPITQNFTSLYESYSVCVACNARSEGKVETLNNVILKIPKNDSKSHRLQHLITDQFQPEEIEYKCEKCGRKAGANRQTLYAAAPRALIMSVNRVEFIPPSTRNKITDEVRIPKSFRLFADSWADIKKQVGDEFDYDTSLVTSPASEVDSPVPSLHEFQHKSTKEDGTPRRVKPPPDASKRPRSPGRRVSPDGGKKAKAHETSKGCASKKEMDSQGTGGSSSSDSQGSSSDSSGTTDEGEQRHVQRSGSRCSQESDDAPAVLAPPLVGAQAGNEMIKKYQEWASGDYRGPCEVRYKLRGVIRHIGSGPYYGHYVADILDKDGVWKTCNDSVVSPMQEGDWNEVNKDGYILYYAAV